MGKLFCEKGLPWEDIEKALTAYRRDDIDWRRGRVPLYVFYANDEISEITQKSYLMFFTENSLGARALPSVAKLEPEALSMAIQILNGDSESVGNMTSGGTESIFMAVKTARN